LHLRFRGGVTLWTAGALSVPREPSAHENHQRIRSGGRLLPSRELFSLVGEG
jgi:hypothetical protein